MTVYVESNFVLEQTLQQEPCDVCDQIIRLADSRRITLAIPAFSLAEPHQALGLREKARNRFVNDFRGHIREIGRSRQHRTVPDELAPFASILIRSAEREQNGLRESINGLLKTSDVIPLDADVLIAGSALQSQLGMSGQDALVLASVIRHLERTLPPESCFLSRNSRDFDDPDVREKLDHFGCRYFARFDAALRYILDRVPRATSP